MLLGQALIDAKMDELCFVDYVTSDVATYLAQQSAARSPWPTVTSSGFDLNSPIDGQGLDPASFDVVIAFDVLHATPNIQRTLGTLRDMLLPGGHLAIIELDGRCLPFRFASAKKYLRGTVCILSCSTLNRAVSSPQCKSITKSSQRSEPERPIRTYPTSQYIIP